MADFHLQLAALVRAAGLRYNCSTLAFAGGVWQNAVLVDLVSMLLEPEFRLLWHREFSPNDESVSYGQLALANTR